MNKALLDELSMHQLCLLALMQQQFIEAMVLLHQLLYHQLKAILKHIIKVKNQSLRLVSFTLFYSLELPERRLFRIVVSLPQVLDFSRE